MGEQAVRLTWDIQNQCAVRYMWQDDEDQFETIIICSTRSSKSSHSICIKVFLFLHCCRDLIFDSHSARAHKA